MFRIFSAPATARPTRVLLVGAGIFLLIGLAFGATKKTNLSLRLYQSYARSACEQSWQTMYETRWVEYPPLSIGLMAAAYESAEFLAPAWRLVSDSPSGSRAESWDHFGRTFCMFGVAVQAGVLVGLFVLWRRLYGGERPVDQTARGLGFLFCSLVLTNLLYHRLDGFMAALVLASLGLLIYGRWLASFAVLAAAIHFKLVPAALAPLWIVAALPCGVLAGALSREGWARFFQACAVRGAVLCGFVVAWAIPFYVAGGPKSFAFFSYHQQRGIECESIFAALLAVLSLAGHPVTAQERFGCWELHSPISDTLVAWSMPLLILGLAAAFLPAVLALRRSARSAGAGLTVAEHNGGAVIATATLLLMVFAGLGKVFSPQFALWILPLVPLLPFQPKQRLGFQWTLLAACVLTRFAFPVFMREVGAGGVGASTALLLTARTFLWCGLAAALGVHLWRSFRESDAQEGSATGPESLRRAA